jgi:hypothetical protein
MIPVDALRSRLRTEMNNYADDLATGACKSFDEYQHLCGVIRGLATAERHLIDLAEEMEKQDE